MEYQTRNLAWDNESHTAVFMEVILPWIPDEWIPFVATADYDMVYGRELFQLAVNGDLGEVAEYVAVPAPVVVPQSVQALQGLLAIDFFNLATEFDAWAKSPERTFAERAFIDKAQTWRRNDQTVLNAANFIGLSASQLDQMFITAAGL